MATPSIVQLIPETGLHSAETSARSSSTVKSVNDGQLPLSTQALNGLMSIAFPSGMLNWNVSVGGTPSGGAISHTCPDWPSLKGAPKLAASTGSDSVRCQNLAAHSW